MSRSLTVSTFAAVLTAALQLAPAAGAARASESSPVIVDPDVRPAVTAVAGLAGGPAREVGAIADPAGEVSDFVAGEVLLRTAGGSELDAFLGRYAGKVLSDGGVPLYLGPGAGTRQIEERPWHLVRIEVERSPLDDLTANLVEVLRLRGDLRFSSEAAARTAAAVLRERRAGLEVDLNWVFVPADVLEHTDGSGGNIDFENRFWMTEDDDLGTAGDQGLSIGLFHAWEYLEYQGSPILTPYPSAALGIAIVDVGFALDTDTGEPQLGNLDYMDSPAAPLQFDFVDDDGTAGGPNLVGNSMWHGQSVAGVAAAYAHNFYGAAGSSGRYGHPIPMRIDLTAATASRALATAIEYDVEVVNMSFGGVCNWLCELGWWWHDFGDRVESAVLDHGMVLLASAGNESLDLDGTTYYPCEHAHVLCVGAIDGNGMARGFSNFGGGVDIWAPDGLLSTVNPVTDANPAGIMQLQVFGGTSAATPFVSGISALLKVLDHDLDGDQVRTILQSTSNPSSDSKVAPTGSVDAYRAALAALPNKRPQPEITHPPDGSSLSYLSSEGVLVLANDWESDFFSHDFLEIGGQVQVRSSVDGLLCVISRFDSDCPLPVLSLGSHDITATATDPHGGVGTDTITVRVENLPPSANIVWPPDGATFGADQLITLIGVAFDPEDQIQSVSWTSNLNGFLGSGESVLVGGLAQGPHTLTFEVVDALGSTATDTVEIDVRPGQGLPTAVIQAPEDQAASAAGVFELAGIGLDPEEGTLPDERLVWTSNVDGFLGVGRNLTVELSHGSCGVTQHTITLTVTDGDGNTASVPVHVSAGVEC